MLNQVKNFASTHQAALITGLVTATGGYLAGVNKEKISTVAGKTMAIVKENKVMSVVIVSGILAGVVLIHKHNKKNKMVSAS